MLDIPTSCFIVWVVLACGVFKDCAIVHALAKSTTAVILLKVFIFSIYKIYVSLFYYFANATERISRITVTFI